MVAGNQRMQSQQQTFSLSSTLQRAAFTDRSVTRHPRASKDYVLTMSSGFIQPSPRQYPSPRQSPADVLVNSLRTKNSRFRHARWGQQTSQESWKRLSKGSRPTSDAIVPVPFIGHEARRRAVRSAAHSPGLAKSMRHFPEQHLARSINEQKMFPGYRLKPSSPGYRFKETTMETSLTMEMQLKRRVLEEEKRNGIGRGQDYGSLDTDKAMFRVDIYKNGRMVPKVSGKWGPEKCTHPRNGMTLITPKSSQLSPTSQRKRVPYHVAKREEELQREIQEVENLPDDVMAAIEEPQPAPVEITAKGKGKKSKK